MSSYLVSISELLEREIVMPLSYSEGVMQFPHITIKGTSSQLYQLLYLLYEQNKEDAYADFYYAQLSKDEKQCFVKALSREEETFFRDRLLMEIENGIQDSRMDEKCIYFRLDEELLEFLAAITERELLFSSFYFGKSQCTIWGNYNDCYVVFCRDSKVLEKQIDLLLECRLEYEIS